MGGSFHSFYIYHQPVYVAYPIYTSAFPWSEVLRDGPTWWNLSQPGEFGCRESQVFKQCLRILDCNIVKLTHFLHVVHVSQSFLVCFRSKRDFKLRCSSEHTCNQPDLDWYIFPSFILLGRLQFIDAFLSPDNSSLPNWWSMSQPGDNFFETSSFFFTHLKHSGTPMASNLLQFIYVYMFTVMRKPS